jgi:hypothetical protein
MSEGNNNIFLRYKSAYYGSSYQAVIDNTIRANSLPYWEPPQYINFNDNVSPGNDTFDFRTESLFTFTVYACYKTVDPNLATWRSPDLTYQLNVFRIFYTGVSTGTYTIELDDSADTPFSLDASTFFRTNMQNMASFSNIYGKSNLSYESVCTGICCSTLFSFVSPILTK